MQVAAEAVGRCSRSTGRRPAISASAPTSWLGHVRALAPPPSSKKKPTSESEVGLVKSVSSAVQRQSQGVVPQASFEQLFLSVVAERLEMTDCHFKPLCFL